MDIGAGICLLERPTCILGTPLAGKPGWNPRVDASSVAKAIIDARVLMGKG
jgi:hypothetical protein